MAGPCKASAFARSIVMRVGGGAIAAARRWPNSLGNGRSPMCRWRCRVMVRLARRAAPISGALASRGIHCVGADRTTPLTRRYDPRVRLPEIGLDSYKARFYDPQIGRFMTPDPAGMVDGPNLYAYVLNDPVNFTDPSGLRTCMSRPGSRISVCTRDSTSDGGGGGGGGAGPGTVVFTGPPVDSVGTTVSGEGETIVVTGLRRSLSPIFAFLGFGGGGGGQAAGGGRGGGGGGGGGPTPMMMREERVDICVSFFEIGGTAVGALAAIPAAFVGGATGFAANVGLFSVAGGIIGYQGGVVLTQQLAARESPSRSLSPGRGESQVGGAFFAVVGVSAGTAVGVFTAPAIGLVSAGVAGAVGAVTGAAAGQLAGTNIANDVCR